MASKYKAGPEVRTVADIELSIDEYNETPPDDALQEIAEVAPTLTSQERLYVYWRAIGVPPGAAFSKAGYVGTNWRLVETRPKIRTALQDVNEKQTPEYRITQQKVIGMLMQAAEIAIRKDQSKNLTDAAVALAEITGVKAAAKIQIQSDNRHTHSIQQSETKALQHVPRTSLEDFLQIRRTLPAPRVIEAEFIVREET